MGELNLDKGKEVSKVTLIIIGLSIIICGGFYSVEQFTELNYLFTTGCKIVLFGVIPYIIYYKIENTSPMKIIKRSRDKKSIRLGLLLGTMVIIVIWTAYFIVKSYIDLDLIAKELMGSNLITPKNFPFVALYITFGNSFLEEFFFRGFIFLQIHSKGYKKLAYIFSSGLFAVYHVAIFKTWFNPWLIALALFGLFIGGLIFDYINLKSKSILNSWIVHICADISIMVIGFIMFY
ncbi:MAG: CPBP family intramembrane glutamic endopeptidase [Clostridium sp.]|uniref:CPBP family intramembrane glutamic endopeptidase n=1 Tax=Clostridium sp. TaxID=1506 RepID=UPI00305B3A1A